MTIDHTPTFPQPSRWRIFEHRVGDETISAAVLVAATLAALI